MREIIQISSIDDVDDVLDKGCHRFYIKRHNSINEEFTIFWAVKESCYEIYNHHTDIDQILSREQLLDKEYSNIGEEIQNGSFYAEI